MCFVAILAPVCIETATGKNLIYIFITLFDIINLIFDISINLCVCRGGRVCGCVFLIDVHYASFQHKPRLKIKGKWGFSGTFLELVRT